MNFKTKKAMLLGNVVFLIFVLAFFLILLIYVSQASTGKLIYEKAYAKQIALLIDEAKPGMSVFINVDDAVEIAEKNNIARGEIFKIDESERKVIVKLGKEGFSYSYFSNLKINLELAKQGENNILIIKFEA